MHRGAAVGIPPWPIVTPMVLSDIAVRVMALVGVLRIA